METQDGRIICGTMTNLFIVSEGRLYTPDLGDCGIHGIMRRVVMEQAQKLAIECDQIDVHREYLLAGDEIFMTNSNIGIWPVAAIEAQRVAIGPITRKLMSALASQGVIECRT